MADRDLQQKLYRVNVSMLTVPSIQMSMFFSSASALDRNTLNLLTSLRFHWPKFLGLGFRFSCSLIRL